ncbi:hypothetical protein IMAU30120_01468 [Lactobacillus helveticus]|nr:hypothetical protein [Lactobacillus helveticus]
MCGKNRQIEKPWIKNEFLADKEVLEYVLYKTVNQKQFTKFIEPSLVRSLLEEYQDKKKAVFRLLVWAFQPSFPFSKNSPSYLKLFYSNFLLSASNLSLIFSTSCPNRKLSVLRLRHIQSKSRRSTKKMTLSTPGSCAANLAVLYEVSVLPEPVVCQTKPS